jgi:hypothetical protein
MDMERYERKLSLQEFWMNEESNVNTQMVCQFPVGV